MPSRRRSQSAHDARTGRPLTSVLELLGRRWMLRVLWELGGQSLTFRALRTRCGGMSPSVLNRRISELRKAGLVEARPADGYHLTNEGRSLLRALQPIGHWVKQRTAAFRRPLRARPQLRAR